MNLVERAKKLLTKPRAEWETISSEAATVQGLYTGYVMALAAIPAIANLIGFSVVGIGGVRVPIAYGVTQLVIGYAMTLASIYLLAIAIDALAPTFGAQRNFMQAMKLAAYMPTAGWLAGVFNVVPVLAILTLVGGLYSLYLLFIGLPILMKPAQSQSISYTVVVMLVTIVMTVTIAVLQFLAIPPQLRGF